MKALQLIYEGKDITDAVEIHKADITDNAGGIADSLEIWFDDPEGFWGQWKPKKNDKVQVKENGFDSGLMYIDELEQCRGLFVVRALAIPQDAKTENTKAWENVRFLEIASELARKYGFQLETYDIQNPLYERVDQFEQADFAFLAWRCLLEGYMLKITSQKVVIYDERYMEAQAPVKTIYIDDFDGDYKFLQKSAWIYGGCRIFFGDIKYEYKPSGAFGPVLKFADIFVSSQAEAERFAKNILRSKNKYENTGYCTIELAPGIAAGNVIQIQGVGMADGKYFCEQVTHKLANKKTFLKLRKPLEGY